MTVRYDHRYTAWRQYFLRVVKCFIFPAPNIEHLSSDGAIHCHRTSPICGHPLNNPPASWLVSQHLQLAGRFSKADSGTKSNPIQMCLCYYVPTGCTLKMRTFSIAIAYCLRVSWQLSQLSPSHHPLCLSFHGSVLCILGKVEQHTDICMLIICLSDSVAVSGFVPDKLDLYWNV